MTDNEPLRRQKASRKPALQASGSGDPHPMKATPSVLRGLQIVADAGDEGIRPREFAKEMWPDSPGWQRSAKSGPSGSHRGGGMYLTGGAFLGRLQRAGLTLHTRNYEYDTGHAITQAGLKFLEENR